MTLREYIEANKKSKINVRFIDEYDEYLVGEVEFTDTALATEVVRTKVKKGTHFIVCK